MFNPFRWLMENTPGARTGYKAIVDGKIIEGCGECRHNKGKKESRLFPEIHRCDADVDLTGNHPLIIDPGTIPEFCPFRCTEVVNG